MASRLCLLLAGSLALLTGCSATPSDVALVYCTAPDREAGTVEAAVSLGLAGADSLQDKILVDGRTYTFSEWRDQRPDDFARACDALAGQTIPAAGPNALVTQIVAALISLATLAVGVAATWFTTSRRDEINRRKLQAAALHDASRAFVTAVRDYCDARLRGGDTPGPPPVAGVRHARDDLAAQLTRTEALQPAWTQPAELRDRLAGKVLGDDIETDWDFKKSRDERQSRAKTVTKAVNDLDSDIDVVVRALEGARTARRKLGASS